MKSIGLCLAFAIGLAVPTKGTSFKRPDDEITLSANGHFGVVRIKGSARVVVIDFQAKAISWAFENPSTFGTYYIDGTGTVVVYKTWVYVNEESEARAGLWLFQKATDRLMFIPARRVAEKGFDKVPDEPGRPIGDWHQWHRKVEFEGDILRLHLKGIDVFEVPLKRAQHIFNEVGEKWKGDG